MKFHVYACVSLFLTLGCNKPSQEIDLAAEKATDSTSQSTTVQKKLPAKITNKFGMTFCLVSVDIRDIRHQKDFPKKSFYLQETELTYKHFEAYRKAIAATSPERSSWFTELQFPTEWREVFILAGLLSAVDHDYDYRLPTRAEWSFACMNGYDQSCPGVGALSTVDATDSSRPNKYGIKGFMNYDAECAATPGIFVGKLHNSPGEDKPECRCKQFTTGSPDADDGLNELIIGRYVLVPNTAKEQK